MKCEICGKEFAHLGLHINYQHKDITQKEYYDRYLKQGGEGFCFTCGQPLPFVTLIRGYKHYCNAKCELADKRVVEKAKQTYKEKPDMTIICTIQNLRSALKIRLWKNMAELDSR